MEIHTFLELSLDLVDFYIGPAEVLLTEAMGLLCKSHQYFKLIIAHFASGSKMGNKYLEAAIKSSREA